MLGCGQPAKHRTSQNIDQLNVWIANQEAPHWAGRHCDLDRQRDTSTRWGFNRREVAQRLLHRQSTGSGTQRGRSWELGVRNWELSGRVRPPSPISQLPTPIVEPACDRVAAEADHATAILLP